MKVVAPGKLLLTGAYAVLEGAPAIVLAVDRYAVADARRTTDTPTAEVQACNLEPPPWVDARALQWGGVKLGLGSSAAVLVASLAARATEAGEELIAPPVRERLFARARAAHAAVQGGGSGVDLAASVYGGLLAYRLTAEGPSIIPLAWTPGLSLCAFWSGTSARTSVLRNQVDAWRMRDPHGFSTRMSPLCSAAESALQAILESSTPAFLHAAREHARALAAFGHAAHAPLVSPIAETLLLQAEREHGVFFPSGAGGGDMCLFLGEKPPSPRFLAQARSVGMHSMVLARDRLGVRCFAPR